MSECYLVTPRLDSAYYARTCLELIPFLRHRILHWLYFCCLHSLSRAVVGLVVVVIGKENAKAEDQCREDIGVATVGDDTINWV
jgi:hypothetical protein